MLSALFFATALTWQGAIQSYNEGTEALASENVVVAMHHYYRATDALDPFPLMTANLYQNLALAHLFHAQTLPVQLRKYHFERARDALTRAEEGRCQVQSLAQHTTCMPSIKIQKAQAIVVSALSELPTQQLEPLPSNTPEELLVSNILVLMHGGQSPDAFLPFVLRMQRQQAGCHDVPWKTVLPLYSKGQELLISGKKEQAILYWEEALLALRSIAEDEPDTISQQRYQKALQALQEMELADPIRPYRGTFPRKPVTNPW